jgi:hypothetical protein
VIVNADRELAGWADGIIRSFDQSTFENVVSVRGTDMLNLLVASGPEALTYVPGDVVTISIWHSRSGRGTATYRIGNGGRVIKPGTGAAARTVEFMRSALGRATSEEVFADRITSETALGQVSTTSSTFVSLLGGPEVTAEIGATGRALVGLSTQISAQELAVPANTFSNLGGRYGFIVSGATTLPGSNDRSVAMRFLHVAVSSVHSQVAATRMGSLILVEDLNPGTNTFTAQYAEIGNGAAAASFQDRNLTVIAF